MTIQIANNNPRISYTATGGQTAFPTSFAFFVDGDINVYINDVLKTLTTDYAVTGGSGLAGTVTLVTGATAGDIVVLTRDVELERTTDFPTSGPFQVASLNVELDKLVAMIADMEDFAGRGLRLSDSDTSAALVLANKDARKGTVLAFNTVTGAVEVGPTIADTQSIADIKADIAALADIQDGTVATDAITDLAAIASDVTTAADNIAAIQGASTQAANAATSATASATSASAAATSATAAAASATAAETAETNAETAETNAETAETNAATSATASASSATASAGSATASAASATAAAASETAAQTAETNAETAETNAETAETNASTSATASAGSATAAAGSATAAASSATAAAASETAAATSETNAATSETNAATSATAAASSASTATTQASNASTSATNAAASYDNFDDRYLGSKASDPTLDNDGDALITGALYFNSTAGEMRVYSGSAWVAAYLPSSDYAQLSGATFTGSITATEATFSGNTSVKLPAGTDAQRPTGVNGMLRYNSDDNQFEGYADGKWGPIAGGGRNLLINGAMNVAQRGTSSTGITSIGYDTVDRMKTEMGDVGTVQLTMEQSTDAPADFSNSAKYTVTTADTSPSANFYCRMAQHIEAQDLQHLSFGTSDAKSLTLSFWVKASIAGTYTVRLRTPDTTLRHYTVEYSISSANTWEYKTITVVGDASATINNDNGAGLSVLWWLDAGSTRKDGVSNQWEDSDANSVSTNQVALTATTNATWQITGVQLKVGTVATEFEHRSFGAELALCQRYYHTTDHIAGSTGHAAHILGVFQTTRGFFGLDVPVAMRGTPSISMVGSIVLRTPALSTEGTLSSVSFYANLNNTRFVLDTAFSTSTANTFREVSIGSNGAFIFDAEL